jgi:hypothetical protein
MTSARRKAIDHTCAMSGPPTRYCAADRRPKLQRRHAGDDTWQLLSQCFLQLRAEALARRDVFGDDDGTALGSHWPI